LRGKKGKVTLLTNKKDWTQLQADPKNRNATFAVASQWKCLDGGVKYKSEDIIKEIWGEHSVQGERATFATLPALVYRTFCLTDKQRYILDKSFTRGYKKNDMENIYRPTPRNTYIGIHSNISSMFYLTHSEGKDFKRTKAKILAKPNKIHQVLLVAFDLNPSRNLLMNSDNDKAKLALRWRAKEQIYLQIEGAILATIRLKSPKLFLTILGGGSFGNNPMWVFEALDRCKNIIYESGLEVVVHSFATEVDKKFKNKVDEINEKIRKLGKK
jgi:hypothetical protein